MVKIKDMKQVPNTRFSAFVGKWDKIKLGELLTFKNGINADKEKYGHGIKFINVLDIINNQYITYDNILGKVEVSEKEFEKNKVEFGDILFQRSSETREEVGQANVYLDKDKTAVFGGFVIRGKKVTDYHPFFMKILLGTEFVRKEITTRSGGSTRYNVGQDILKDVEIVIPTLPEQQKISSFISAVDQKLQKLTRKKELLEQYKRGVMQKIFSREIRFKDENGNDYPDWEEKRLGEVGNVITGSTPPTSQSKFYGGDRLFVSPFDIQENRYVYRTKTTLTDEGFKKGRKVGKGSVLFVCIGSTIGKIGQSTVDCVTNQQINSIVVNNENDNNFIYSLLEYKSSKIKKLAGLQAVPIINKSTFENYYTFCPILPEQQKVASFLSNIDKKIESVQTRLTKTQTYKKGLLQQMFV